MFSDLRARFAVKMGGDGEPINSYDLLKLFAIITMFIDHMGFFFFPEYSWMRLVGRLSFPCWMFLIGYANTRRLAPDIIAGAVILLVHNIVMGQYILPLNMLITILTVRALLGKFAVNTFRSRALFFASLVISVILAFPSGMIFEYGALAYMAALFGYYIRHRQEITLKKWEITIFIAVIYFCIVIVEAIFFGFSHVEALVYAVLFMAELLVLSLFKPKQFIALTNYMPSFMVEVIRFCGRHTLVIYVMHLLVFYFIAFFINAREIDLFSPHLIYTPMHYDGGQN